MSTRLSSDSPLNAVRAAHRAILAVRNTVVPEVADVDPVHLPGFPESVEQIRAGAGILRDALQMRRH